MSDFDLTLAADSTTGVRLYERGLRDPIRRTQSRTVPQNAVTGGTPEQGTGPVKAAPGDLRLRGVWIDGSGDAETQALRLRDAFLNDPTAEDVVLQAVDGGTAVDSPYNGTYRIGEESEVRQVSPSVTTIWGYRLRLIEAE